MPPFTPTTGQIGRWADWIDNQDTGCRLLTPGNRHELVAILKSASDLREILLKPTGGHHSSSPVARPRPGGYSVQFNRFELDHDAEAPGWLHDDPSAHQPAPLRADATLVRINANAPIGDVNTQLAAETTPRALLNLGSYDAQSVIGAVATATHGTGMASGPVSDFVASLEMVAIERDDTGQPKVTSYRIEPTNGITDPARFAAASALHKMQLIQDDQVFYSAVVSMGCFGIVTALTLQVVPAFSFIERRSMGSWPEARATLDADASSTYFDLTVTALPIHSFGMGGEHQCLKTFRTAVAPDDVLDKKQRWDARIDALKSSAQAHPPRHKLTRYLADKGTNHPRIGNYATWENAFRNEVERYEHRPFRARSHITFRTSIADWVYATSAEVVVPKAHAIAATERAIGHSAAMHARGLHHLSPYGVRFVKASPHYLAPEYGQDSCTVEAPIVLGARKQHDDVSKSPGAIDDMLHAFCESFEAAPFAARFHWGQRNELTYRQVRRQYPRFESCWMVQYDRFNVFGNFNNAFTDQLGISR